MRNKLRRLGFQVVTFKNYTKTNHLQFFSLLTALTFFYWNNHIILEKCQQFLEIPNKRKTSH